MENWIQQFKNSFLWNCGSSHWTLGTLERQSLTFTIDSLGNWSSNPVFVKISSSISMDLKNIWKRWNFISINSNQLGDSVQTKENLPNICGNSAFNQLGNTSIEDLYILLTNTASQFESEWYFECLKNFKLNCLYVLINFFFSFLFNSFVDFAIKLFVQNNNCFQTHKCFNQNFSHSENLFCLFNCFFF